MIGLAEWLKCLSSKTETLSSNPSTTKTNQPNKQNGSLMMISVSEDAEQQEFLSILGAGECIN
jgi:hypothetical protein